MAAEVALSDAELWIGEMRGVVVRGVPVVLVRSEAGVCAYRDRCPHQAYPLSEGRLENGVITCRVHHHTFDAKTGSGINPPRPCLRPLPSRVEHGQIVVELSEPERVTP
jgi:toluene monooxygenase system ferredoxin subunit